MRLILKLLKNKYIHTHYWIQAFERCYAFIIWFPICLTRSTPWLWALLRLQLCSCTWRQQISRIIQNPWRPSGDRAGLEPKSPSCRQMELQGGIKITTVHVQQYISFRKISYRDHHHQWEVCLCAIHTCESLHRWLGGMKCTQRSWKKPSSMTSNPTLLKSDLMRKTGVPKALRNCAFCWKPNAADAEEPHYVLGICYFEFHKITT